MVIDWLIFIFGMAGFIGTLRGWPMFYNEERMERSISRYGRQRIRTVVATFYLLFGVLGLFWIVTS